MARTLKSFSSRDDESTSPPDLTYQLLASVISAVEAESEVEGLLDLTEDEAGIDLRDLPAVRPDRRGRKGAPAGADPVLALVLNRARYRTYGVSAVRSTPEGTDPRVELASLGHRSGPPDVLDLIRQASTRRPPGEAR